VKSKKCKAYNNRNKLSEKNLQKPEKHKNKVEKEWRSLKYSVNSETISKNNEETIINNVRIKQLATRKNRKQDDDTKISKLHNQHLPPRCQLTENKTDSNNLKEASRNSAKQGKSIIPARRWLLFNRFYGSLNKTD
jgi:hypothetical protein